MITGSIKNKINAIWQDFYNENMAQTSDIVNQLTTLMFIKMLDDKQNALEAQAAIGLGRVHPHKFRRTLATKAIDKGMPIEQVQKMLGHAKIDTTLEYAMVDENNVKISHKKYLE